ncbi:MAG TPA: thioredoxin [Euzebya sp.]|nr:thioredoxin [Euzebya sp.]
MNTLVRDVDEADFTAVVVEGSRARPVVVDFWAEWCGPCHQLSPALEQAAQQFAGEVDVVKVDVDANQRLAQQFGVRGIPAVKAFADGRMVAEFTGVQPTAVIQQFFSALAPTEADKLVARAAAQPAAARELLGQALEAEVDHPGAALGLARLLADEGDVEGALAVLAKARPTPEVQQMQARLNLVDRAGDVEALTAAVAAGEDQARVSLGNALAAAGQHDRAIEVLLEGVRVPATRDEARDALLEVFTVLGNDDPRVKAARPKLAAGLF